MEQEPLEGLLMNLFYDGKSGADRRPSAQVSPSGCISRGGDERLGGRNRHGHGALPVWAVPTEPTDRLSHGGGSCWGGASIVRRIIFKCGEMERRASETLKVQLLEVRVFISTSPDAAWFSALVFWFPLMQQLLECFCPPTRFRNKEKEVGALRQQSSARTQTRAGEG